MTFIEKFNVLVCVVMQTRLSDLNWTKPKRSYNLFLHCFNFVIVWLYYITIVLLVALVCLLYSAPSYGTLYLLSLKF